jgi:hypothetical protein
MGMDGVGNAGEMTMTMMMRKMKSELYVDIIVVAHGKAERERKMRNMKKLCFIKVIGTPNPRFRKTSTLILHW